MLSSFDHNGVPAVVDLAAMRDGIVALGGDAQQINPLSPVVAPQGAMWDAAVTYWRTLQTDDGATFDHEHVFDARQIKPTVSWGISPAHAAKNLNHPTLPEIKDFNALDDEWFLT